MTSVASTSRPPPLESSLAKDDDGKANIIEYFMGTLPADAGSNGVLTIPSTEVNIFV